MKSMFSIRKCKHGISNPTIKRTTGCPVKACVVYVHSRHIVTVQHFEICFPPKWRNLYADQNNVQHGLPLLDFRTRYPQFLLYTLYKEAVNSSPGTQVCDLKVYFDFLQFWSPLRTVYLLHSVYMTVTYRRWWTWARSCRPPRTSPASRTRRIWRAEMLRDKSNMRIVNMLQETKILSDII